MVGKAWKQGGGVSAVDELFALLEEIGATPTLYGKPITATEAREFAVRSFSERVAMRLVPDEPQWRPWDPHKP